MSGWLGHLGRRAVAAAFRRYAARRVATLDRLDIAATQERTLRRLVRRAADTRFGRDHGFARVRSFADFQERVPLRDYEAFWQTYWQPTYPNLVGATWSEPIPYYALSSGTTSGSTKYLPVSRAMLASNRRAALTTLAWFVNAHPQTTLFDGRLFFLGGSTALTPAGNALAGDLSGIAAREASPLLRPFTFPPPELGLLADWDAKVQRLAEASLRVPITAVSGVPAWLLVLFERVRQLAGTATVAEAWPALQAVVHGGTKFEPYRDLFAQVVGPGVRTQEVYPCSEGFVAAEDPRHPGLLRVIPDHGVVSEFVPVDELGRDRPTRHPLAAVEPGVQYAVALTTCAGLWGYLLGDTVSFERRDPPLLRFTGRTKYFLSAFGEHLISEEVERAVAEAARQTAALVTDFHVGPVFPTTAATPGHHRYFVEFAAPADTTVFATALDTALGRINEDYAAHRNGDLSLTPPDVVAVPPGGFAAWMRSRGKLGGQHKVPRMDNSGAITSELASWFASR